MKYTIAIILIICIFPFSVFTINASPLKEAIIEADYDSVWLLIGKGAKVEDEYLDLARDNQPIYKLLDNAWGDQKDRNLDLQDERIEALLKYGLLIAAIGYYSAAVHYRDMADQSENPIVPMTAVLAGMAIGAGVGTLASFGLSGGGGGAAGVAYAMIVSISAGAILGGVYGSQQTGLIEKNDSYYYGPPIGSLAVAAINFSYKW